MGVAAASAQTVSVCYHCGDACKTHKIEVDDKSFCCNGCKSVYELLSGSGLCTYYELNATPGNGQNALFDQDRFAYLDQDEVRTKLVSFDDGNQTHVAFYLPQIHCSSCLWLLEHVGKLTPGIIESRLNFSEKELFVVFENGKVSLRKIVETLAGIGYEPHLSLQSLSEKKMTGDRAELTRIAVAGFCFANIMMMSLPEYFSGGVFYEQGLGASFRYISLALSLPVVFYAAKPFFRAAFAGFRSGFLNIDVPVAAAILMTFLRSLYEMFVHNTNGYWDSMSGIVFFMLAGRYLQNKSRRALSFNRDYKSFFPIAVDKKDGNAWTPTDLQHIRPGDELRIKRNEIIPVDCLLSKGKALIDYSFVSGESLPVAVPVATPLYAGGRQTDAAIEVVATKEVAQSYLTNLWARQAKDKPEEAHQSFIHKTGNLFTLFVLIAAAGSAAFHGLHGHWGLAANALTTVLIVACPCALLLASSFTQAALINIFSRNGLYLRDASVLENMASVNHIVFDKTGTLTTAELPSVTFEGHFPSEDIRRAVYSLFYESAHPLSKAIAAIYPLSENFLVTPESFKEFPGAGFEAWTDNRHIKVGSAKFLNREEVGDADASVHVVADEQYLGRFVLQYAFRPGLEKTIAGLRGTYGMTVLSGDNAASEPYLRDIFGLQAKLFFRQMPDQKAQYIDRLKEAKGTSVLMLGDGLNDAAALRTADVGMAVAPDGNNFTPASDCILSHRSFALLPQFLQMAKMGKRIINAGFALSFVYNAVGLWFALQGTLSPLIAAILMPCSSLSILALCYGLTARMAKRRGL